MGFLKKLFSTKQEAVPANPVELSEGDLFYTHSDNQYRLYKLLVSERDFDAWHVMSYKVLDTVPTVDQIGEYEIMIYHLPMHRESFRDPVFLAHGNVTANDLTGYHVYLQQTCDIGEYVHIAKGYYLEALKLTDEKQYLSAIDTYSKAIDLIPEFFEAIDNRSFCLMDLARWNEAIEGFEQSLAVNPNSVLAEFSIGECHLRLGDYHKAKARFEKAHQIAPDDEAPKLFLKKVNELLGGQ